MPYIKQVDREGFKLLTDEIKSAIIDNPGDLNYLFTLLIKSYMANPKHKPSYQRINDVVGALEGAKLEFYRRVATPYEDGKIIVNGDVYE